MISTVQIAKVELGKFFQMFSEGVEGLTMPSKYIDNVWHDLLQQKENYKAFCKKYAGQNIDHVSNKGSGNVAWIKEYEKRFGKLSPVWFMDSNGVLDKTAYNQYKMTGKWIGSWKCEPKKK